MEKLFEATIKDAETNEILTKISSYSQEGLEEEMGKTKWTKFASKEYEEEKDEEETLPEDNYDKEAEAELEKDYSADKKMEELDADTLENL